MIISYNPQVINKPPTKDHPDNRKLGYGWVNVNVSYEAAFDLLTTVGYPVSCQLSSEGTRKLFGDDEAYVFRSHKLFGTHRDESAFVSRQLFMVDIDNDEGYMSVDDLLKDDFFKSFGAGYYTSHSHTESKNRFRILFITDSPITNYSDCRLLHRAFMEIYPTSDKGMKDATRIYFSNTNSSREWFGRTLNDGAVKELLQWITTIEEDEYIEANAEYREFKPLDDEMKERILSMLCSIGTIVHRDWVRIGAGLKAGGYGLNDFDRVTTTRPGIHKRTSDDARRVWNKSYGKVSMGSVIKFLKDHDLNPFRGKTNNDILKVKKIIY